MPLPLVSSMWLSGPRSLPASSAALPQTPRSCKLVQGQPHWREGKMARDREKERERMLPITHLGHVAEARRRGSVCFQYHHQLTVMWHQHMPQPTAQTVAFRHETASLPRLLLSLGHESQNKSVLDESKAPPKYTTRKLCITATDLHGGLWWMALRQSHFVTKACLNWLKKLLQSR